MHPLGITLARVLCRQRLNTTRQTMKPAFQLIGHRLTDLELHPHADPSADGPIRLDTELIWDHSSDACPEWRLALIPISLKTCSKYYLETLRFFM